jgi:hypothetical protein
VGSFPEPFLNGTGGQRLPVREECAEAESAPCRTVLARLRALGVPAALSTVVPGEEPDTLRVLVGQWRALAIDPDAEGVERGPASSGVYARVSTSGTTLTLLDAEGAATRTLTAGAGLIAATRYAESAPVWIVSGTDAGGVALAAKDFDRATLQNRFAVALTPSGAALALPQPSP